MIRMIQSNSAGHAKAYFSEALSKADYYINDQELKGKIQGKLADRLKLSGEATKDVFFALCENIHPVSGQKLTPRQKDDRRVGYDINFHCPKSVSILHALSGDNHIMEAFEKSVRATMEEIEADSMARVRKDGRSEDRQTGELVWTDFIHQTARPVDESAPDPHLHAHCFVFNMTWDPEEQRIKAGQFGDINRDMPYYEARFQKRLSDALIDRGYEVRRTGKNFELEGVPQNVIDLFSKRTDEIGRIAKEKGITDAKELDELGSRTRAKKQKGMSMTELKANWRQQIADLPRSQEDGEAPVRFAPEKQREILTSRDCVEHAISHTFERASVIHDRRLLATAYRHGIGNRAVTLDGITADFKADYRLIHVRENGRTMSTTKEVLNEERHMVKLARAGQGKLRPLYTKAPKLNLDGQQAQAVEHILTTTDRVSIIRGVAGSGKTTLMKEAVKQIEKTGKTVTVVAPTSQASRGVLKDEGFEHAETVAQLLADKKIQDKLKNQVLWVDEAGLLGTRDMSGLLDLAHRQNARLILGGDTRQHASVARGDALRILNTVGGIKSAEVSKIYRQKGDAYRSIVEDLSKGNVAQAFQKLDDAGAIKEIDPLGPNTQLIDDYVEAIQKGKSALVISPTHEQGQEVTKSIRQRLQESGHLGKKQVEAKQFIGLNLTTAQKADWRNLQQGHMVQFNQNRAGIGRGSVWAITSSTDSNVYIKRDGDDEIIPLPTEHSDSYDIYKESKIALAKGDLVRITRNGFDNQKKRLNNGQILQVSSVRKSGAIALHNPVSKAAYKLDQNFGHLAHAYCVTSHSSQGRTTDEVFLHQPTATFGATDAKQIYVSVSRGRERVRIYTDYKDALMEHAKKISDRKSAIELIAGARDTAMQNIRQQMEKHVPKKEKDPVDIYKPIRVTKDYEPGI